MKSYDILKTHCRNIYLAGTGNFWYEEGTIGDDKSVFFISYRFILFSTYGLMTVLEILAAVCGDHPEDEKSDAVTFAVSHTIVMIKIFSVILKKDLIKTLNREMVEICEPYEKPELMSEKYKAIKMNVIGYFVAVYGTAACFMYEGLRKMQEGSHFVTVVTYYPSYEDYSILATVFRVSMTIVLMMMMLTMIMSVDGFTMMYLIMYKYKIITLRHYFEGLRREFDRTSDIELAAKKLANGLIEGIVMHGRLLRISKDIDSAFGTVLALQVCQSSGSAVSLLLQIATSDQLTFVARMKIVLFVIGLFFLLALFVCNAGEITYQASLLADSIFYCGWHACPARTRGGARRGVRGLALQACAQAQRPLVMKAFKMLELTYGTFLLVVRGTYSVFALFYANKK